MGASDITKISPEEVTALLVAIQDERYEVRSPAVRTLLRLRDPSAVPQLVDTLAIATPQVRTRVAFVLGELGDHRAVEPLIALLQTGDSSSVFANERAMAAEALGRLGDSRAVEPLIAALSDNDLETRAKAMGALGRLGDRRAVEPLIAFTRERQDPSGATILGNLGDRRAVEPLIADLETLRQSASQGYAPSFPWQMNYYYYVIRALGKIGDLRAIPLLEWIRDHQTAPVLKDKSLADVAVKALARLAEQSKGS